MQRDIHPEIESPYRRKKTEGGLKLSLISKEPDSPIAEKPDQEDEHKFDAILPYWDQVVANLEISKQQFEDVK